MSEGKPGMNQVEQAPQAQVSTKRSFSIIWVVPIIALLIGGWLAFKAQSEKGPVITIAFETAEGLTAGKTQIKFKDVEVGKVTAIDLSEDRSGVIVTAEMSKGANTYLTDKTQFWVVRAQVAAGEVSGLGTLLSGAYIGCNPSTEGQKTKEFKGLEKPPLVTAGMPGHHFILQSKELGSLDRSSPVYYRGVKVGQVVDYEFDHERDGVDIKLFIEAPFHNKVHQNTRFWNASGVDFKMDATGIKLDTQSLVSIMLGGVAFDLPKFADPGPLAGEDEVFDLFQDRASIEEKTYTVKRHYLLYFDQNVRGLSPGAPVEMKGIPIGEVVDVQLEINKETQKVRIPVLIVVEPERVGVLVTDEGTIADAEMISDDIKDDNISEHKYDLIKAVNQGMRAQLKTGNLLTGQLYIDVDFYPDAPSIDVDFSGDYPVLPTLETPLEQITESVARILKQVEKIPFEDIGKNLDKAIKSLNATLEAAEKVAGGVNEDVLPELKVALEDFQKTMDGIDQTLGADSALNYNARNVMSEMSATIRSLRALIDYVERNPQSIIFGKEMEE